MPFRKPDLEIVRILTTEARASHPHVFKPSAILGSTEQSYSIELLFDKKTTDLSQFQKAIKEAVVAMWGPDKNKWPKPLLMPYRDGDKPHGKKKEVKPEHKGQWVVKASSSAEYSKPHVVGRDPNVALTNETQFYPGCYCRAALKAHAYTFADKDGVKFILDGVQFTRDGAAFGGKRPADQTFGIIEGDAGDDEDLADIETDDAEADFM